MTEALAGGAGFCHRSPEARQQSAAAASRLGSRPLVGPRLSEVLLDCGDVPVGGLRPHGGRREGGDG